MSTTITNSALKTMKSVELAEAVLYGYLDHADYQSLDYYHNTHPRHFYGTPNDAETEGCITMGVEIESDNFNYVEPGYAAGAVYDLLNERNLVMTCKYDGSLSNGLEVVSEPATLAFHMQKYGWADVLKMLSLTSESHDAGTCGLHVHVSRKCLGHTDEAKDLCTAKLIILLDKWLDEGGPLVKFSRRSTRHLNRWAAKNTVGITNNDSRKAIDEKFKAHKNGRASFERYLALNLKNVKKVEFRIFRGTHNPQTFAATLQLVEAMVRYCKTHTTREVQSVKFGDIVATCKYAELSAYCNRMGIDISTSEE